VPLADISDVTTYLPVDRIPTTGADITGYQLTVERMIKAYLTGVYTPLTLSTWTTPDNTPAIIREVAGKLIAGLRYRDRTSEEEPGGISNDNYGQRLYNEAMDMLRAVRSGDMSLVDVVSGDVVATDSGVGIQYFPSDNAPLFTIGQQF
jgi:hypothetical protein